MAPKVEIVVSEIAKLGEGPHWDEETQSLYYVDINSHNIHKYVPATKKHSTALIGKQVSIIIPVEGKSDQFVITYGREIALITWDGESEEVTIVQKLYEVDENTENVFNDGKCDPSGRLWAGTIGCSPTSLDIPDGKGSLFSFQNKKVTKHLTNIGVSNGLAFNTERKKLYYIDSFKGTLDEYDFDIEQGTISNGKPIFTLYEKGVESEQILDGMTIDTDGNLWVAVFHYNTQSRVIKINPQRPGAIVETIQIPAAQVTSVAFGGPNLDELYVTSGRVPFRGVAPSSSNDGATYRVTGLNVKGLPGVRIVL